MSPAREAISFQDATPPFFIGVDVGGTSIKFGLVDDTGRTVRTAKITTHQERGADDAVSRIAAAVDKLLAEAGATMDNVTRIGLGTPGTMDVPAGMLLDPPNLPAWNDFPIRDRLSDSCEKEVTFLNDGAAAAFGEFWIGSGRALSSLIMLTLGTGVGGGIILDDLSIDGEHSHGAECGHVIIDSSPDARVCSCGQPGHLEAYASATGVTKRLRERLDGASSSSLHARIDAGEPPSTLMLAEEAEAGDEFSRQLIWETAEYLSIAVTTLVHTIDPAGVILGGAMDFGGHGASTGREFLARIRKGFPRRTFPVLAEHVIVDFASLGGDAGYIGAAGAARATSRQHLAAG